jgi:hypothetical protein
VKQLEHLAAKVDEIDAAALVATGPEPAADATQPQQAAFAASAADIEAELAALDDTTVGEPEQPSERVDDQASAIARIEFAKSSNIRAASLGADGVLTVEFKDGARYRYGNFTVDLLAEWEGADSAGRWFHQHVRTKPDRHPVLQAE